MKDRSLGLVITNLFSVQPFSLKSSLAIEVQQSILQWLVSLSFLEWLSLLCCWQCFFFSHMRCSGPTSVWCLAFLNVYSEEVVSWFFYPGSLPAGELKKKKNRLVEILYFLYILCLLSKSWSGVMLNTWSSFNINASLVKFACWLFHIIHPLWVLIGLERLQRWHSQLLRYKPNIPPSSGWTALAVLYLPQVSSSGRTA